MGAASSGLSGKTIMVVEDEYLIALNIEFTLIEAGAQVLGPFSAVDEALDVLSTKPLPAGAILDINIRGRPVFPVASALQERGVPFVFATGYDNWTIPQPFAHIRRFEKPTDPSILADALGSMLGALDTTGTA